MDRLEYLVLFLSYVYVLIFQYSVVAVSVAIEIYMLKFKHDYCTAHATDSGP